MVCCKSCEQTSVFEGARPEPTPYLRGLTPNMGYCTCFWADQGIKEKRLGPCILEMGVVALSLQPSKCSVASVDPSLHGRAHREGRPVEENSKISTLLTLS